MGTLFLAVLGFVIYFLPTIIGWNKRTAPSIMIVNVFLGWTLIGWVVALAWAASPDKKEVR